MADIVAAFILVPRRVKYKNFSSFFSIAIQ